ncbi:efflux RND transporter permease subunit [Capnocytophaga sp.]|uniref:efflux RND transporter permease subunit n=1 Tax=Capnocytophaga sp. TaxID=44737 RepID=UPI0026DBECC1|nr:efflux RND transporter permease subunit [Capnocytophaga sp.]MDO5105318.1 efflux RND transporter permease subunit [Capnocytophaga sp.]
MLNKIFVFISKHKYLAFILLAIWGVIAVMLTMRLRFEEDITQILPQNEKTTLTAKVLKQLNFADKISVIITKKEGETLSEIQQIAGELRDSISSQLNEYITDIQGIVSDDNIEQTWNFINSNLPLFLNEKDYKNIENKLNTDSLRSVVTSNYKTMLSPTGIVAQNFIRKDPFGLTFNGLKKLQELNIDSNFKLTDGFLTTLDQQNLLFFINPKYHGNDTEHNAIFVQKLEKLQSNFNLKYSKSATCTIFGAPFIAISNSQQIKTDIFTTVIISLAILYLVLTYFYKSFWVPFIAFIPSVLGVVSALAILYVFKGKISAISISLGAVLLGVTVDYSLHILTHLKTAKNHTELYQSVTKPIMLSSITTAISFLCLLFVHSEVMNDLGIFAAVGILVASVLALIFIPQLYRKNATIQTRQTLIDHFGKYPFHKNKYLVISCIVLICISLCTFSKVQFNNDISKVNYVNPLYQEAQNKLEQLTNSKLKSVYVTAHGNSLDEALTQNQQVYQILSSSKEEGKIQQFSSLGNIILPKSEQQKRIDQWHLFWNENRKAQLKNALISIGKDVGFKENTYLSFFQSLETDYQTLENIDDYKSLSSIPLQDFITEQNGFYTISNLVKVSADKQQNFIQNTENQTSAIIIDRKKLNETFLGKLKDDFLSLVTYASVAIFIVLLLFFRRIELVLLTLIPITVTGVVTSGIMNLFGVEFNVFSMIVCTLVLGHSVDFSIFMTCALQKDYTTGKNELPVYKVSVLLASITTLLAIGALIFAKHPALKSIALVSIIGIFTALVITFVFYPTVFRWFIFSRPQKGRSPVTLRIVLLTVFSTLYYVTFSIILSYISKILLFFFPKRTETLRRVVSKATTSVLYSNPFVKKKVINPHNLRFEKSSVIIANHTSWLDTLAIGMLTHRISYMVNDWVYNSPVFGKYVRSLGFFPASKGIENGMDIFRKNIDNNISIMIFPEGTRSDSNHIYRFHKGAFYIAETFGLPIVPVYIHGNSEVQPKNDFFIYDGAITVIADTPISIDDERFGNSYSQRTKKILAFYRERFYQLRKGLENADYLKNKLWLNFLYKEPYIVRCVMNDFAKNKEKYHKLNQNLPQQGRFLHLADDYGQTDFLLLLTHPKREIITVIADDYKRAVARQSYITRIRKLTYIKQIPDEITFDTIIISDKKQKNINEKHCIRL